MQKGVAGEEDLALSDSATQPSFLVGPRPASRNREGLSRESNLALLPAANQTRDGCDKHQHHRPKRACRSRCTTKTTSIRPMAAMPCDMKRECHVQRNISRSTVKTYAQEQVMSQRMHRRRQKSVTRPGTPIPSFWIRTGATPSLRPSVAPSVSGQYCAMCN